MTYMTILSFIKSLINNITRLFKRDDTDGDDDRLGIYIEDEDGLTIVTNTYETNEETAMEISQDAYVDIVSDIFEVPSVENRDSLNGYSMKYFTFKELSASDTARAKGIDNTMNDEVKQNYLLFVQYVLDPIREKLGKPMRIASGYRCPALNKAVGGVSNSHHQSLNGYAAVDISLGTQSANKALFELVRQMVNDGLIIVDQCLNECRGAKQWQWIHISFNARDDKKNRRQFIAVQAK